LGSVGKPVEAHADSRGAGEADREGGLSALLAELKRGKPSTL